MQHTCQDCGHAFNEEGQNGPHIQPAVQCPQCHSYRTQPSGIPDETNDMLHGLDAMPTSTQDDMSGNPLKEGILADGGWKNRQVRDEAFASVRSKVSLFETPDFETTQIVAPPDLYRHALETEAAHRAHIQTPNGITDNLHAALGNLGAWVENPYENGELRPYHNKYWKSIRPSFMKPGSLQIGVADPTMAEIINHVAQTDDLTPLYQYRGKESHVKTAGPLLALLPEGVAGLLGGGAAAGAADAGAAAAGAGEAGAAAGEAGAAAGEAGAAGDAAATGDAAAADAANPGGIAGMMKRVKNVAQPAYYGIQSLDDLAGMAGHGQGGGGGGMDPIENTPYYSRTAGDEDDAYPTVHDEIPKNEDGDSKQQADGNNHEWQRDISVNGGGGTDHAPQFQHGGPALDRFLMLAPLLLQYLTTGEDGSQDPLIEGLHQSLESEIPGYLDHADDNAANHLVMILQGGPKQDDKADDSDQTHTDENAGGKRESKTASLHVGHSSGGDFLPDLDTEFPALRQAGIADYYELAELRKGLPADVDAEIDRVSRREGVRAALEYLHAMTRSPQPTPPAESNPYWDTLNPPVVAKTADTQGPHTPQQIQAVQKYILEHGQELGLQGQELTDTILSVPTNPMEFADVLAKIQQAEPPPVAEDAGMSAAPPAPAQENAPPSATMPVPPMQQQMLGAIERYAQSSKALDNKTIVQQVFKHEVLRALSADSVAGRCPNCGGHTTALVNEDGSSVCHGCGTEFKTKGKTPNKIDDTTSSVHEALRMENDGPDIKAIHGVPIADQQHQRDVREEQDSGHTWTDESGAPLQVGQEYEMYSSRYDIPDLVRIESIKPDVLVYSLTGEFGLEHSTELSREEANIERISFVATNGEPSVEDEDSLEENNDDNTGFEGTPETRDVSGPSGLFSSSVHDDIVASGVTEEKPQLAWLKAGGFREAGANYTQREQRALIEESGIARNADRLILDGTHYVSDADDDQFLFGF